MHGPASVQPRPHPDAGRHNWARYYARLGWPVLPLHSADNGRCSCGNPNCGSAGEHSRTQHGVNDASTDLVQIDGWWQQWPDANIGIPTGVVSGLVVLDMDPRNGGDQSNKQLQIDIPDAFNDPLGVRCGSGVVHLYFKCPNPIPSRANIRPGIDIKADGGYVVAPNSRHVSGKRYLFSGLLPSPLPAALVDLILGGIQLDKLRVGDPIKVLLRNGKPKGERSQTISAVISALIKAGHSDDEIIDVLMHPANGLSEKPRDKGLAWLSGEVKRARANPTQSNTSTTQPGSDPGNTTKTQPGSNSVLISRPASAIPREVADRDIFGGSHLKRR